MQLSTEPALKSPAANLPQDGLIAGEPQRDARYAEYKIIRRNGAVVGFEPYKISVAVTKPGTSRVWSAATSRAASHTSVACAAIWIS